MQDSDRLTFHQLRFTRREDGYVVSYEHTNSHVIVDDQGKKIIEELHKKDLASVKQRHKDYDIDSFVKQLIKNGLVHKINSHVIEPRKHVADLFQVPKRYAKAFTHPAAVGILLGIIATGLYLLITQPVLVPTADWLFATSTLTILIPLVILAFFAVSFVHELGHHIMMQALGYSRALTIEHRWHMLRPRADISKLHTLTDSAKNDVKIAGVITDLLIMSKALIITAITQSPLAQLIALLAFVHLLGQALVHPAADLHFEKKKDCKLCELFTPRNLLGIVSLAVIAFAYAIPATYELIVQALQAANNPITHIDGVIALILITATLSFSTAANLYDHQYNQNKAYQSLMISATSTALLMTTLLVSLLILA